MSAKPSTPSTLPDLSNDNPERPMWDPTPETIAVRRLVDVWGRTFTLAFFPGVSEEALARCYYGMSVDAENLGRMQKILKERMT